jgi:hypothetical protein
MPTPETEPLQIPTPTATIRDFLAALSGAAPAARWYVSESGGIFGMRDGRICSPLTAAAEAATGKAFPLEAQHRAAAAMGLASEDADAIIAASRKWGQPRLRAAILAAVGLAEPPS